MEYPMQLFSNAMQAATWIFLCSVAKPIPISNIVHLVIPPSTLPTRTLLPWAKEEVIISSLLSFWSGPDSTNRSYESPYCNILNRYPSLIQRISLRNGKPIYDSSGLPCSIDMFRFSQSTIHRIFKGGIVHLVERDAYFLFRDMRPTRLRMPHLACALEWHSGNELYLVTLRHSTLESPNRWQSQFF